MNSIVYIGMDVHKESYNLCCYRFDEDKLQYHQKIAPDYRARFPDDVTLCLWI